MKQHGWLAFLLILGVLACMAGCHSTGGPLPAASEVRSDEAYPDAVDRPNLSSYTVIYSAHATEYEKNAAKEMRSGLAAKTGLEPDFFTDNKIDAESSAYEILVGDTNREPSAAAVAEVTGTRFVISEIGNKIVIQASNDTLLPVAVAYFLNTYVSPDGGVLSETPIRYVSEEQPHLGIVKDGKIQYQILYSRSLTSTVMTNAAKQIASTIRSVTGLYTGVSSAGSTVPPDQSLILVGRVSGSERSEELWKALAPNAYGIFAEGNQIYILGKTDRLLKLAVDRFCSLIKYSLEKGETGTWDVSVLYDAPIVDVDEKYAVDYPLYSHGEQQYWVDCANNALECISIGTGAEEYRSYRKALEEAGFSKIQENASGNNLFATYANGEILLTVNYLEYDRSVRVFSEFLETAFVPTTGEFPESERITESTLTVKSLHYEAQNVNVGNNGLAMIFTLADGSFLIYDGGNTVDADSLYEWLSENNLRRDGKIVIAAWVITHSHADHYGCFQQFSTQYGKQVELEAVIASPALMYRYAGEIDDSFLNDQLSTCIHRFAGTPVWICPHMGQRIQVRNATIEIMMTAEDVYPSLLAYGNESSMVSRVRIDGKSVIMFGDCENEPIDWLISRYGSALKSDIIQVPHHGNSGGTKELYRLVDPDIAIFPTSAVSYQKYTDKTWKNGANYYLVTELASQSYHAGDTVVLPLDSPGDDLL